MTGYEFLFTFYGLLLGLAIANVATGFADIWRSRDDLKPGWTTALLGLFILLAAAAQWVSFWGGRETLMMGPWELIVSIAVAFPYIFVSQVMFPRQQDRWASLDEYYLAHRAVIFAVLLVPPLASLAYNGAVGGTLPAGAHIILYVVRIVIPVALIASARLWLHRSGLALLCAAMLVAIFVFFR